MMTRRVALVAALAVVGMGSAEVCAESGRASIQGTAQGSPITGTATFGERIPGGAQAKPPTQVGRFLVEEEVGELHVTVRVTGASPGKHGLHIHQYGSCDDGGNAAGGHYNPDNAPHGFLPQDGLAKAHPGDLGNIEVGADGTGSLTVVLPGVSLSGGHDAVAGRSIILHEKPDDMGQPTGNAGGRIGCGTIVITKDE